MILALDTSLGTGVAVVEDDGEVRGLAQSADPRGHAETIGPLLREAVGELRVAHVAVGMGPGPFTGLRVGIAAARAFALARGIRVVPVVSHDAVALAVLTADAIGGEDSPRFAVVTDARRREVAISVYDGLDDDGLPVRIVGPELVSAADADAHIADAGAVRRDASSVPPVFVGLVAGRALAAGRAVAADEPVYLRSPDVTVPRASKRVTS